MCETQGRTKYSLITFRSSQVADRNLSNYRHVLYFCTRWLQQLTLHDFIFICPGVVDLGIHLGVIHNLGAPALIEDRTLIVSFLKTLRRNKEPSLSTLSLLVLWISTHPKLNHLPLVIPSTTHDNHHSATMWHSAIQNSCRFKQTHNLYIQAVNLRSLLGHMVVAFGSDPLVSAVHIRSIYTSPGDARKQRTSAQHPENGKNHHHYIYVMHNNGLTIVKTPIESLSVVDIIEKQSKVPPTWAP